ncbi:MAG: hypothetical protein AABZ12_13025 [Planctomycetota bacterium]
MSGSPGSFQRLRVLQVMACMAGLLSGVLLVGLGFMGYGSSPNAWMAVAGVVVTGTSLFLLTIVPVLLRAEATLARQLSVARDITDALARQTTAIDAIVRNTSLSDAAKSLARRDEELQALRAAINEDIRHEKWEAALNLIDEIERRFGYREEAERSREELDEARNARIQATLAEAIEMIEGYFASHDWERAEFEIERLANALPDDARVLSLTDRMRTLKEQHKQELRVAWEDAVRRNDTDLAIEVLKGLDQYLSPAEAQVLQSTARHVFKEKLLQLGVQFRFAVNERRWSDALETGLELIREFPNARMANEVREVLDTLRERARQVAEATASGGPV